MDWHFRVHQRVTDAERRGQHRSWWVEQSDWVNSLEAIDAVDSATSATGGGGGGVPGQDTLNYDDVDDDDDYDPEANFNSYNNGNNGHNSMYPGGGGVGGDAGGGLKPLAAGAGRKGGKKGGLSWLPVPEDSAKVNNMCPICQERFEMKWLDEAQEWVWMDAMKVGERVYHASCHKEVNGTSDGGSNGMSMMGMSGGENGPRKRKAEVSLESRQGSDRTRR